MNKIYTNPTGSQFVEFSADMSPRKALGTEIATRDIDGIWSKLYQTLPNPDPVLRKTGHAIDILDELRRENHVSSCSTSRESGCMKQLWKIEPEKAAPAGVELLENLLKNLPMRQIMREICEAWGYGFQVSEVVWKRQGNFLLPEKIVGKPRRWFVFGQQNELRLKTKAHDIMGTPVDPRKFLLTQYRASYDNPYGEAHYSMCFWPVTFKKGGIKFWAVFLEKFGMPHAVGKIPRSASNTERSELLQALSLMIRDACAVFPDDASVELITSNVTGSSDAYERFAKYHDGQISTVILGHSSGADSTPGRLGGEDTAMQVREDIINNDTNMVKSTFDTLIRHIYELNPTLGPNRPCFSLYKETDVDKDRAERDSQLLNTGKVKLTKKYYVKRYDFDEEDIDIVEDIPPEFAAAPAVTKVSDAQSEIDTLAAGIPDALLQKQIEALLKPVIKAIEEASSFDEVREKVAELFPELDSTDIEKTIEKAIFLGETWGRLQDKD